MNIITNDALIRRNANIGRYTSMAALLILAGGMYVIIQIPDQIGLYTAALLVGFLLSQIGIYFGNRWGRSPRPDELINQALKGFNKNYTLYHFSSPVSHLLVGPAGIWVIHPRHQRGLITFENGRLKQKGGGLRLFYMKIFAQEGLGRPDLEIQSEVERLHRFFSKEMSAEDIPPIQVLLVFTHPEVEIEVNEAPYPVLHLRQLKDFIRKQAKEKHLSVEKAQSYQKLLENA